jgi:2,4-dienoyl-CoA reductase-like NADH-dependent reductase (Old Yellow Enzyme family)
MSAHLFSPWSQRGLVLRNRIVVSPMCQYSAEPDGRLTDWHLVHLGSRAVGGAGLVFVEATSVEPRGRLSLGDSGLWGEHQSPMLARIADFVRGQGAAAGIQLTHAGRKAWTSERGHGPERPIAPSALPFDEGWAEPEALDEPGIEAVVDAFRRSAKLARAAGFDVVEIHAAHGYLIHQFLSPLANHRTDAWGGSLENRARLLDRVVSAVRDGFGEDRPVWVRFSCSDWLPGGFTVEECAEVARRLAGRVDVVDCSSGGVVAHAPIPVAPGYQVPFAEAVRRESGVPTCAVGLLTDPAGCDAVIREGRADFVALAREELRDPYFPLHAATALGVDVSYWPKQYLRARPR